MNILQNGLFEYLFGAGGVRPVTATAHNVILVVSYALAIVIPYLLGSVNSAIITSRIFFRDDIRRHGSGNAGLTNMFRTYGAKGALPTLLGDILKTVLALLFGGLLLGFRYVGPFALSGAPYLSSAFCIIGHIYPIFYRMKGGKGVLCSFISVLALMPIVAGVLFCIFVIIVATTRYISLGSTVSAALFPVFLRPLHKFFVRMDVMLDGTLQTVAAEPSIFLTLYSFFILVVIVYCHRANLKRLLNHEESKFSFHRSHTTPPAAESGEPADGK